MSGSLFPAPLQYFDDNGNPLANGKVWTYIAGTSTPKATYSDYALSSLNTNPVQLDAAGRVSMWGAGAYKIITKTAAGATVETRDDMRLSGLTTTVVGDTSIDGGLTVDYTSDTGIAPFPAVRFSHDNAYWSTGSVSVYKPIDAIDSPYATGSVTIESTALNNNQPLFIVKYNVNTTSVGNVGPIIWNVAGTLGNTTSTDTIAATLEMVANNPAAVASSYTPANGKWELGSASGVDSGDTDFRDGYFYISPRRSGLTVGGGGAIDPTVLNSGFDGPIFSCLPASLVGGARFLTRGVGIEVTPRYDYLMDSRLTFTDAFNNSIWRNEVTLAGKYARIENEGQGNDTYIRTQTTGGAAQLYCQANDGNFGSTLNLRSNWLVPGTGSSVINLYVDNAASAPSGWKLSASGAATPANSIFGLDHVDASVSARSIEINPSLDGLVSFFKLSDSTLGRIRLGNNSGAAGSGTIEFDGSSGNGVFTLGSTNSYVVANDGDGLLAPERASFVTTVDGGTTVVAFPTTVVFMLGGNRAAQTITVPTTPPDNYILEIAGSGNVTTLTMNSADGTAVINGAPASFTAYESIRFIYRSSNNNWYKLS